jgi:uncharacterized protein YdaU (DUF1376 family)
MGKIFYSVWIILVLGMSACRTDYLPMENTDSAPLPFTSLDDDVRCLDGFMLNVERLLASETVAIGNPSQICAALMLWCRAWKQVPGGSLPNDERILASFSGAGARWKTVRDVALRGFVLCSDGRLYHRYLCEEVKRSVKAKRAYEARRDIDQKRLVRWRERQRETALETPGETVGETRFVAEETRREEKIREDKKESPPHPSGAYPPVGVEPEPAAKANGHERRKARREIPADWQPSEQDRDYAHTEGYADEWIAAEAAHFVDHHRANDSLFADHSAAWRNWVRNATKFAPRNGGTGRPSHVQNPPSLLRAAAIALGKAHLDD